MIRYNLAAIIVATASPAFAQVIPGIEIGQPKAEAIVIFGGRGVVPITGQPGAEIATRPDGYVMFCNGKVTSIQRKVGTSLHAFTDLVGDRTREHGEPVYTTRHYRASTGEISTLDARWDYPDDQRRYTIGMFYSGSTLDVTETISHLNGDRCGT
jgi:hypothetical protein